MGFTINFVDNSVRLVSPCHNVRVDWTKHSTGEVTLLCSECKFTLETYTSEQEMRESFRDVLKRAKYYQKDQQDAEGTK